MALILYDVGSIYSKTGRYQKALSAYERAEMYDPQGPARFYIGNILRDLGQYDKSLESYRKYVDIYPNDPNGWHNIAWIYETLQDFDNALNYYAKSTEVDPNYIWSYAAQGSILIN